MVLVRRVCCMRVRMVVLLGLAIHVALLVGRCLLLLRMIFLLDSMG